MSETFEAIILGIIQGLTEFLPISSSGHLELAKWILGDDSMGEQSLLMTVVLHGATAIATLLAFWKEVVEIIKGLFSKNDSGSRDFAGKIIVSMIPATAVGLVWEDLIESLFNQKIILVGLMLIVTAALLFLADRAKNTVKSVGWMDSFIIGISQAIAILPGISRSGATISTSVLLGIDRTKAARFSFLMVVPLILGKLAKDMMEGDFTSSNTELLPLVLGFISALVMGYLACKWMIVLVKNAQLKYFAMYCVIVAIAAISFFVLN